MISINFIQKIAQTLANDDVGEIFEMTQNETDELKADCFNMTGNNDAFDNFIVRNLILLLILIFIKENILKFEILFCSVKKMMPKNASQK